MFIIKPAFAETVGNAVNSGAGGSSMITSLFPLFLILAVFYFMVIRPQNKRLQSHRDLINNLKKGDKIITGGGLIGKIKKLVGDDELLVEFSEGNESHVLRSTVMMLKTTKAKTPVAKKS